MCLHIFLKVVMCTDVFKKPIEVLIHFSKKKQGNDSNRRDTIINTLNTVFKATADCWDVTTHETASIHKESVLL